MSLRDRILPIQTEPEHVERAPRRERWKRQAWMIFSTLSCLFVTGAALSPIIRAWGYPDGAFGILIAAMWFFACMWPAQTLFEWGVERFDLVAPWQFREAESGDNSEGQDG